MVRALGFVWATIMTRYSVSTIVGSLGGEKCLSHCEKYILPWAPKGVLLGGVSGTCGVQGGM